MGARHVLSAAAVVASVFAAAPSLGDLVTLTVNLGSPAQGDGTFYRLSGQSVFASTRTAGLTTGGQLDGIQSDVNPSIIQFNEVFPETNLLDYLQFAYFGVIETVRSTDDGDQVIDTSLVIGVRPPQESGLSVSAFLPFDNEASLVGPLTSTFDSPEFFTALGAATNTPSLLADTELLLDDGVSTQVVRDGGSLLLYAFVDGEFGDLGVSVGSLEMSVLRVIPAPGSAGVLFAAGCCVARRRRNV